MVDNISINDLSVAQSLANCDDQQTALRDEMAETNKRYVRSYIGTLSMKRAATHYADRMGISGGGYSAIKTLDKKIREYHENKLVDLAFDAARFCRPSDFSIHALGARKLELEQNSYREELFDPGDLDVGLDAFEVYRRGTALETQGKTDQADQMYLRALESDPAFSLALRHHAKLLRSHNPAMAAAHYSEALEHFPKETYGSALNVLDVHRNFLLTKQGKEYIAIPVSVGSADFLSARLRSPARRFVGLFLMRLRLRALPEAKNTEHVAAMLPKEDIKNNAHAPQAASSQNNHKLNQGAVISAKSSPSGLLRKSTMKAFIKYAMRFPVRWAVRHKYLFQFVLIDSSIENLKSQIDKVDREWLSRTSAA